jgi:AcrR family transcriptional regulator
MSMVLEQSVPAGSRQAMRSEATRKALLEAARKVFARDGFEAARIEDIAAEAGRSRGAFYANFANKEAAIFALRDQAMAEYETEMLRLQAEAVPAEKQLEHFERWIAKRIPDTGQILVQLEFKQFAARHPELRRKLLMEHLRKQCQVELECVEGRLPSRNGPVTREQQQRMLLAESVLEGLALNHQFSPELLPQESLQQMVHLLLNAALSWRSGSAEPALEAASE